MDSNNDIERKIEFEEGLKQSFFNKYLENVRKIKAIFNTVKDEEIKIEKIYFVMSLDDLKQENKIIISIIEQDKEGYLNNLNIIKENEDKKKKKEFYEEIVNKKEFLKYLKNLKKYEFYKGLFEMLEPEYWISNKNL